ncbi:Lactonohydrolase oryL [Psilocybe cubensis]|uniref:SMP-30/Gluconolactonase/LRE-like region domain-containing protein n=2 Tax=Psilocybe cubensis TaxID=181762 RepID=A0A8H8CDW2_PSICU|nr:Lactonohydrolase oryL [Psilocybe cubensis]KAH9476485.1 Lactonohydrolase oryL [Psilocybe cubensis]
MQVLVQVIGLSWLGCLSVNAQVNLSNINGGQSVFISPPTFAVLGATGNFRNSSFTEFFNPTATEPPFFQIFDNTFLDILGPNPTFNIVSTNDILEFFAHEAPVFVKETNELFFVGFDQTQNVFNKLNMTAVEQALEGINGTNITSINVPATQIPLPDTVHQINGGTGPVGSSLLFVTNGQGPLPPSVVLVNAKEPFNATVLLDNFFGRQFNSLDDVKIHPTSKAIFFTDVSFGFLLQIRPPPMLPNQVYRFDVTTGVVRVVATDFEKCNGIAFSQDGKVAYVTDTGALSSLGSPDQTKTATIYKFDVDPISQVFVNRRVFAYADTGIPDGIELDAAGNVYAGCGDGVNVWSSEGVLLGKFFTGGTVANMAFTGDGRLVLLGGTNVYLVKIAAKGQNLAVPSFQGVPI